MFGIERSDHVVGQSEIVRAGFRGDAHAPRLRLADDLYATLGGNVTDMHRAPQRFRQNDLARDHHFFRRAGNAFQARESAVVALVHDAAVH